MLWVGIILEGFMEEATLDWALKIWDGKEMERRFIHSMLAQWHEQSSGGR